MAALPTQAEIQKEVAYDPDTGVFTRRSTGRVAGKPNSLSYVRVDIGGRSYLAHRLAWVCVHGVPPTRFVDHINRVRSDNRASNLREATVAENSHNQNPTGRRSTSGLLGAHWHQKERNWQARITVSGQMKFLGVFKTPEEAHEAYLRAKHKLHVPCTT